MTHDETERENPRGIDRRDRGREEENLTAQEILISCLDSRQIDGNFQFSLKSLPNLKRELGRSPAPRGGTGAGTGVSGADAPGA